MTLRKKTLIISGTVICCLMIMVIFATNTILLQGFATLEKQDMDKNLIRAQNILAVENSTLDTFLSDWAFWDDTYEFIHDNNEDYIKKNINDGTFVAQKLNFMMYIDIYGSMVYGQGFDLNKKITIPLPEGLLAELVVNNILFDEHKSGKGVRGIVILPDGPAFIALKPILDTKEQQPARGTMIAGRYLTSGEMNHLADTMQLSLSAYLFDAQDMPEDVLAAKLTLNMDKPGVVKVLNAENIAGYVVLQDIYHNPAMILRVDTTRHIYMQGKQTIGYLTIMLIVGGVLFGGINLIFLEKTILARLAGLSEQVMIIGKQGNPTAQVDISGDDELAQLAANVNEMLNYLSLAQNELRTSEIITSVLLDGIPDSLLRLDHKGVILDFKIGRSRLKAVSPLLLPGRNICECYPVDVVQAFMKHIQEALDSHIQQVFDYEVADCNHNAYREVRIDVIGENEVIAIIRDFNRQSIQDYNKKGS